jgi:hypothetical protein
MVRHAAEETCEETELDARARVDSSQKKPPATHTYCETSGPRQANHWTPVTPRAQIRSAQCDTERLKSNTTKNRKAREL